MEVKIACLANIHNNKVFDTDIPDADILIIAGGATKRGTHSEYINFQKSLSDWESFFKHIVYVPSKHDIGLQDYYQKYHDMLTEVPNVLLLVNTDVVLMGLKIWGSPVSKHDTNWAYTCDERERENTYKNIAKDTDIIVTYSPAEGILDSVYSNRNSCTASGCIYVRNTIERIKPQLHICGGAHESYGAAHLNDIICINASLINKDHQPINQIPVVEIKTK